jgi:XTP/dITP diphosphohydrolase
MNIQVKFASSNKGKLREIQALLTEFNIKVEALNENKLEIQANEIADIAEYSAFHLNKRLNIAVAVEDSGLHISALQNFPGPYSSYVYKTLRLEGILKLLEDITDRTAYFQSTICYVNKEGYLKTFSGVTWGLISYEPKGEGGFGFDPIFIPNNVNDKTFAEMSFEEKNLCSHRGKAVRKFGMWLTSNNA